MGIKEELETLTKDCQADGELVFSERLQECPYVLCYSNFSSCLYFGMVFGFMKRNEEESTLQGDMHGFETIRSRGNILD